MGKAFMTLTVYYWKVKGSDDDMGETHKRIDDCCRSSTIILGSATSEPPVWDLALH